MPLMPDRAEQVLFGKLAPTLIEHIKAVPAREADGLVADVYAQMQRDFQVVPPVTLHAPIPELLAAVWAMLRESIVAGPVSRIHREVVCEGVSAINRCSFCVDAHAILLAGSDERSTAEAIRTGRLQLITDTRTREIARWAAANRDPDADILRHPPFSPEEAPEIIASAASFHYIDRMVSVFLPDAPVPLSSNLGWLKGTVMRAAGATVGKRLMAMQVPPGGSVGTRPHAAASPEFGWAAPRPALAAAFGGLEAVVQDIGQEAVAKPVRELVQERVGAWRGEEPGISRAWLEAAVQGLEDRDRAAGRLVLLVALAPYQIDEGIIAGFRAQQPSDADLLAAVAWGSFTATRQISGWLAPS